MLGNTPRRQTLIRLEARKSFAFGLTFYTAADEEPVDLTGATVRFILAEPAYAGGAVLVDRDATLVDAALGVAQVELQATDLDVAAGEYPFDVTLVSSAGYSTPILKGAIDVAENTDLDTTNVYAGINPSTQIAAYLESGGLVKVEIDAVDGMAVIVQEMIDDFQAEQDAALATHTTEMTVLKDNASASATAAADSATAADASADAAAASAVEAADIAGGATDPVVSALVDDPTSATNDAIVALIGGTAPASHTHAAEDITGLEAGGNGLFRGEWAADALAWTPAAYTAMPAELAAANTGDCLVVAGILVTEAAQTDPPDDTYALKFNYSDLNGTGSITLDLAALGVTNVTRVKYSIASRSESGNAPRLRTETQLDNVVYDSWSGAPFGWLHEEVIPTDDTSVVSWETWVDQPLDGYPSPGDVYLTNIEVYSTSDPYMLGEYVVHNGKLWVSGSDNNPGEPGVSGWTEVPLDYVEPTGTMNKLHGPITQAAYDALATKDPDTLYVIVG